MKKLLLLFLLLPLLSYGQSSNLKHEILETGPFVVGDTITVKYSLIDNTGNLNLRFLQFDIGFDMDKVTRLGTPNWIISTPENKTFSHNHWTGYTYVGPTGVDWTDLNEQNTNGWTYTGGGNEGVSRYTFQSTDDIEGQLFLQQYTVNDLAGTSATDYNDAIRFNWAYSYESGTNNKFPIYPEPGRSLNLDAVPIIPAGTVTFQLQSPNVTNIADYKLLIEEYDPANYDNSGTTTNVVQTEYNFDASGKVIISDLDQNKDYLFFVIVMGTWSQETQTQSYPAWLNDVVTVSDVLLTFKQAIGTEIDGSGNIFEYQAQYNLANVSQGGPNDPVDFTDSYILLAHLTGVLDNAADQSNSTATDFYPITSQANGSMNTSAWHDEFGKVITSEEEWLASHKFILLDDQPVTYNIAHGLMGDANLSHSTTPPLNNDTQITARVFNAPSLSKSKSISSFIQNYSMKSETADVDIISEKVNGNVEVTVSLTKEQLSGIQFNITYDQSILTFKEVVFDTGNTMTNFAKHISQDSKVLFGSIDPQAENVMKTGKPFKLVFETKQNVTNTAGLVSFYISDAVKKDGTKVNLQLR